MPKRRKRPAKKFVKRFHPRKRVCIFCSEKTGEIDYKDTAKIGRFLSERGKITPRRLSGVCARHQRKLSAAIKRARYIALLPFVKR